MQIIDWALIILYMIIMVVVGAYFKTSSSMSDYAVADKKLGLSVLVATFLATGVGGGVLTGSTGNGFASGIVEIPKLAVLFCINIFMALFLAKKMRNIGGFTAPEMLGRVYGRHCQALGGLFCAIYQMGSGPAMQSIALGTCLHLLLGIDMKVGMIIGMIIILFYTLSSGMWGVAMTDYIQFIFLTLGVVLAAAISYYQAGGWEGIIAAVPASHFELDLSNAIKILCATALPVLIDGNRYARFFAAKDAKTARLSNLIVAFPQLMIAFMAMIMGLSAVVLLPADTAKDMVFATLLTTLLPVDIRGVCVAALMAAIMSTADSYMLTGATNISVDIYKNLINPNATDKQMVVVTKVSVLVIGLMGLGFAILVPDIMSVWTLSSTAYVGGCLVPMLYGLFSKRKKSYTAALIAIIIGGSFAVCCEIMGFVWFNLPPIVYGILISALLMLIITPFAKDAREITISQAQP